MSAAAPATNTTATGKTNDKEDTAAAKVTKPAAALEEDDEFEDFPVEGTYNCSENGSTNLLQ